MFQKVLAILLIGALLLQSGREAAIGLWFWANQEQVADQHCINKEEPLLMCQGKCYLQKVIETKATEDAPAPVKLPSSEERLPFIALLAPRPLKAAFSVRSLSRRAPFTYQPLHSAELAFFLFRPPWG